nr:serine protease [Oceaniglobus trochenteri]
MHDWARANHAGNAPAYSSASDDRVITAATLASGRRVYLRSWLREGVFLTLLIQSEPSQFNRAALIAASLKAGYAADITPGDRLLALVAPVPAPARPGGGIARAPDRSDPVGRPAPAQQAQGAGTGFFVNATDVVTAAHVIEGCSALTLADGTPLRVLARAPDSDLAVLESERRSAHWLPLRADPDLRLGQGVAAVGYPFISLSGGALNLTMGNVSALSGGEDRPDWVSISAPVQPGNSGGPLLSTMGEVVGVVVARANDDFYLRETGTLPQNINYAVRLSRLRRFLTDNAIPLPAGDDGAAPPSEGLSPSKQAAIQPVMCY